MFSKYIKSCSNCNTEYITRSKIKIKKFVKENDNKCPICDGYLSVVPLMRHGMTPPPELKTYAIDIKTIKI